MQKISKRLTYANVMSSLAVFLVLGGGAAFAATKIGSDGLKANAVTTPKIAREAVAEGKIKAGAVGQTRLADNSVITNKISNGAVTSGKLADNAVTTGKIADKAVTTTKLGPNAVNSAAIADAAVGTTKIADAAINVNKLAPNSVNGTKIVNGSVTGTKLGSITTQEQSITVPKESIEFVGVGCAGGTLISIGYLWDAQVIGLYTKDAFKFLNGAFARPVNDTGASHKFTLQAVCLTN